MKTFWILILMSSAMIVKTEVSEDTEVINDALEDLYDDEKISDVENIITETFASHNSSDLNNTATEDLERLLSAENVLVDDNDEEDVNTTESDYDALNAASDDHDDVNCHISESPLLGLFSSIFSGYTASDDDDMSEELETVEEDDDVTEAPEYDHILSSIVTEAVTKDQTLETATTRSNIWRLSRLRPTESSLTTTTSTSSSTTTTTTSTTTETQTTVEADSNLQMLISNMETTMSFLTTKTSEPTESLTIISSSKSTSFVTQTEESLTESKTTETSSPVEQEEYDDVTELTLDPDHAIIRAAEADEEIIVPAPVHHHQPELVLQMSEGSQIAEKTIVYTVQEKVNLIYVIIATIPCVILLLGIVAILCFRRRTKVRSGHGSQEYVVVPGKEEGDTTLMTNMTSSATLRSTVPDLIPTSARHSAVFLIPGHSMPNINKHDIRDDTSGHGNSLLNLSSSGSSPQHHTTDLETRKRWQSDGCEVESGLTGASVRWRSEDWEKDQSFMISLARRLENVDSRAEITEL